MSEPPRHGLIKVSTMKVKHAKQHLSMMVSHANESKDYGAHGVGCSSAGAFSPGGAAGADYQTTSVGSATAKIEAVERRQRSNLGSLGTSSRET
jgi:hypothetical protein